jgi:hypothetical protein
VTLEQHRGLGAAVRLPLDTDSIHPDAIRAAVTIGIDRLETEAEKRDHALDWSTFQVTLREKTTEENTTTMTVSARRIL